MRITTKVRIAETEHALRSDAVSKVTTMGNITEVTTMLKKANGSPCRKVDKDHYQDLRTGELFEYTHIENRADSLGSIRRTVNLIRATVNTNVTDPNNIRWITLTYKENMTDTEKLKKDFEKFWKRFTYWCKKHGYDKPEYITVIEPQGRGAWHAHCFFIWDKPAPFISNEILAELWGHGFTKIKAVKDCDNIGAYFSAYLGDMPLDEVHSMSTSDQEKALGATGIVELKEFTNDEGLTKQKKFVKGGRLPMYPTGMNIIRTSKGIKKPDVNYMTLAEAKEKVSSAKETFSVMHEIVNDDGSIINVISKSYYNSKRK